MAADLLAIAVAEIGAIAERRLDRLINPLVSGLPAFLVSQPGVNSGMMIVQYVAASLCAENRQLAQPAVIDNYVTSGLQEDHLSMGTNAGLKLHRALENCTQILAIEYLLAAQAFEFLKEQRFGAGTPAAVARTGTGLCPGPLAGPGYRQQCIDPEGPRPAWRGLPRTAVTGAGTAKGGFGSSTVPTR
jgi:histidine ammonia-lyase